LFSRIGNCTGGAVWAQMDTCRLVSRLIAGFWYTS
jgi:hypothetical protein